jgi:integrase/recombinase XerC
VTSELGEFLRHLESGRQLSGNTVIAYRRDLEEFERFLTEHLGMKEWEWGEVDRNSVRAFLGWCHRRDLSRRTIARRLSAVRSFFRFLHVEERIDHNPTGALRAPKLERRLPGHLGRGEVDSVFAIAEARASENTLAGTRNLLILELLYGSGLRLAELHGMNMGELDLLGEQVKVRGKGGRSGLCPSRPPPSGRCAGTNPGGARSRAATAWAPTTGVPSCWALPGGV